MLTNNETVVIYKFLLLIKSKQSKVEDLGPEISSLLLQ